MATELAKAYVQIIPSAQGIKGSLEKVLDDEAENAGKSAGSKLSSALGTALKAGAAGIAAASAALVKVGKDAVAAYADYEQLVGGVETLFKDSADQVQNYAARAFETAGLSANQYMETVTGFSASLLQSLGGDTEAAAKIGDMAITDMADNANKMGSSMESIQNAYQGFAKQNYTMLDNLKLGYGGTKEEMARLLADATALSGVEYDIKSLSDVYEAIHVIQGELGITGTTAKEAGETISGSLSAMKAAWSNLLVGVADDNADITALVDNFVDSAVTAGENIIPRTEAILGGLGDMLTTAADRLVPIIVETIINNLPAIIEGGVNLVVTLAAAMISAIPQLVKATPEIIKAIINGFVAAWPELKQAGVDLMTMAKDGFMTGVNAANTWGRDLIQNFIQGIKDKIGALRDTVAGVASTVKSFLGFSEPELGPLSDFHTFAPDMMRLYSEGIRDNLHLVENAAREAAAATQTGFESTPAPATTTAQVGAGSAEIVATLLSCTAQIVTALQAGGGGIDFEQLAARMWDPMQRQSTIHGASMVAFTR